MGKKIGEQREKRKATESSFSFAWGRCQYSREGKQVSTYTESESEIGSESERKQHRERKKGRRNNEDLGIDGVGKIACMSPLENPLQSSLFLSISSMFLNYL